MVESVFTTAYERVIHAVVDMRHKAGLTQRQLADILGREQSFVGRIETGQRRLDLVEFAWIAKACGADAETEALRLIRQITPAIPKRRRRRQA